jgi:hypothetical protein
MYQEQICIGVKCLWYCGSTDCVSYTEEPQTCFTLEKSLSGSGSITTRAMGSLDATPGPALFRFDTPVGNWTEQHKTSQMCVLKE